MVKTGRLEHPGAQINHPLLKATKFTKTAFFFKLNCDVLHINEYI